MLRKIIRILLKTLKWVSFAILILLIGFLIAINTSAFQTWLAQRASDYISTELNTKVSIGKVDIDFFKTVVLKEVFVQDLKNDTLLYGSAIEVAISNFSIKQKQLAINKVVVNQVNVKLLQYKGEKDYNFQFLIDYFSSNDTMPSTPLAWNIKYGELELHNVGFTYHELADTTHVKGMNFSNLHIYDVSGNLSDIKIENDTISANIANLTAREQCGLYLKQLNVLAKINSKKLQCDSLQLTTANSYVNGAFSFNYDTWDDYPEFIDSVKIIARIKDNSKVCFTDIAYFTDELYGLNETVFVNGDIRGYVSDLSAKNLSIRYGSNTTYKGAAQLTGVPNVDEMYLHLDAKQLTTSRNDLLQIPAYPFYKQEKLPIPIELASLGVINFKGKFDGFINDFSAYGTFKTAIGQATTDIAIQNNLKDKLIHYHGKVKTSNLNLGALLKIKNLGGVSLDASIVGKGLDVKTIDAKLDGQINALMYNNYTYKNIKLDGDFKDKIFNGKLTSTDENANIDFNGKVDFTGKVPDMDFISTINRLDLGALNFVKNAEPTNFSTQIAILLKGDNLDNLTGRINFDNTIYTVGKKDYKISTFDLQLEQESIEKSIKLSSNIIDAKITGNYALSNLSSAFSQYLNVYFPKFIIPDKKNVKYTDNLDFKIKIKKFNAINDLVVKELKINPNTSIQGSFNAQSNTLNALMKSDGVSYGNIRFNQLNVNVESLADGIYLNVNSEKINITDSIDFKSFKISTLTNQNQSSFDVGWDNQSKPNTTGTIIGNILFNTNSASVVFDKLSITVADSVWSMTTINPIIIGKQDSLYTILFNPIAITNNTQLVEIQGQLSPNSTDRLDINLQNFKLKQLNPLLTSTGLALDGSVTGTSTISDIYKRTVFISDLNFLGLKINNKDVGSGQVRTEYSDSSRINVDGYFSYGLKTAENELIKNIEFKGAYYPKKKEESIDLTFRVDPINLGIIEPYLKDILSFKVGFLSGAGKVHGTLEKPLIESKLKIMKCVAKVDYLNVQYSVDGEIEITPDQIRFEGLKLYDQQRNVGTGTVYGNIFHDNFENIRLDFDVNAKKLMVLNTNQALNPLYYGKAFATGNMGLYGFLDDIKLELNMKSESGTKFYIPLGGPSEIGDNEFIRFVTRDTTKKEKAQTYSGFALDFNLEVTPDAEVQLVFDEKSGDVITASGNGNLNLKIDSKGKFDMFGDYNLTSGDYLFTLENFITKKFDIEKGSSIKWSGSPYNADINIIANYSQRASIAPLFPYDTSGNYKRRYPVDCKLIMTNQLMTPDIKFNIALPTIDEDTRSKVRSILLDEQELNRQVFSLLLLKSFVTPLQYAGGGISAGNAVAATSSEMLSNKVSSWLGGLTKAVDIGVNYRPGSLLSNDELDVALSKQLFNNRLSIDGNFGVNNNAAKNSSSLIGDVMLEYKLTDDGKTRIRGFNRSNDNTQITTTGGPFTQGIGVFYREEFESFEELYKRYLRKTKKTKTLKTPNEHSDAPKEDKLQIITD